MDIIAGFNGEDGCWDWPLSRNCKTDYGQFVIRHEGESKLLLAHRVSYSLFAGIIQNEMDICHRCDNPPCINPKHLFAGTTLDNMADMRSKGRSKKKSMLPYSGNNHWARRFPEKIPVGTKHHASKLTEDIVREARQSPETLTALAKKYGVAIQTLSAAINGKTWRHV